jgi:type IV pilus assembly protein PilO
MKIGLREIVFLVVMIGLLGATWWFVFKKANERRMALEADVRTKQTALENLRNATTGIDNISKKLSDLQKAIAFFESKLPQEREIDKIVGDISKIAQANNLNCKSIKTLKIERTPHISEQPIELVLEGNFAGFYEFMLQIEKLPRITRTTKMELDKISDRDGETEAKLVISIFFEPERTGTPTSEKATALLPAR